jgi:hypothetical protein
VGLSYSWGLPTRAGRSGPGGATAGSSDAESDFLTRRTSPGVLRYFDFNDASQIDGEYGDNYGVVPGAGDLALDTSVKASGTSSLRFDLEAGGHATGSPTSLTIYNASAKTRSSFSNSRCVLALKPLRIGPTSFSCAATATTG